MFQHYAPLSYALAGALLTECACDSMHQAVAASRVSTSAGGVVHMLRRATISITIRISNSIMA